MKPRKYTVNVLFDKFIPEVDKKELVNVTFEPTGNPPTKCFLKKLKNAMEIGNTHKIKVKIVFDTNNGVMSCRTTIWFVGKKYLLVKGNIAIPIESIYTVE